MFSIHAEDGEARAGVLKTAHGPVKTPNFKAVATKGAVKLITSEELIQMGARSLIANAFMLYLRPGLDVIEAHGGLHRFMVWDRAIFTDCGGFQVLSLENGFHMKTSEKGIQFRSPFDGSKHLLTPEKTMEIESRLGSDVAMALDHMPLARCSRDEAITSLKHTHAWMAECRKIHEQKYAGIKQLLFGIAQGSVFPDLRRKSVRFIDSLDFDGIAFGGLAIGEPKDKMHRMIRLGTENCSKEKPRYVMGVGSPDDILRCILLGVDTFDSVFPTRNARHGQIFTQDGPLSIENAGFKYDTAPPDTRCKCIVCRKHTRAYLNHLFRTGELLGLRLASYHNLYFIHDMLKNARKAIAAGEFRQFVSDFLARYNKKAVAR